MALFLVSERKPMRAQSGIRFIDMCTCVPGCVILVYKKYFFFCDLHSILFYFFIILCFEKLPSPQMALNSGGCFNLALAE